MVDGDAEDSLYWECGKFSESKFGPDLPQDIIGLAEEDWRQKFLVGSVWKDRTGNEWRVDRHRELNDRPMGVVRNNGIDIVAWHKEDGAFQPSSKFDLIERVDVHTQKAATAVMTSGCNCSKDKFGFWFHATYCPLYVHQGAAMAINMELAEIGPIEHKYLTEGDKRALAASRN